MSYFLSLNYIPIQSVTRFQIITIRKPLSITIQICKKKTSENRISFFSTPTNNKRNHKICQDLKPACQDVSDIDCVNIDAGCSSIVSLDSVH